MLVHDVTNTANIRQLPLEQVLEFEDLETNVTKESRRHQHRGQFSMKSHAAGLCELLAANLALVSEGHQRYERL